MTDLSIANTLSDFHESSDVNDDDFFSLASNQTSLDNNYRLNIYILRKSSIYRVSRRVYLSHKSDGSERRIEKSTCVRTGSK